ncbi:hypothetical protein Keeri_00005 [Pseudomonas phage vB_PpuP-Keeri]
MISLNHTSFTSLSANIVNAMAFVLHTGDSKRLINRRGNPWLLVTLVRDQHGYRFAFIDNDGREVGHMILKAAAQLWSEAQSGLFFRLNAEAYELVEHPIVTLARKDAEQAHKDAIKETGATHKVISYGGAVVGYGGYQRDWLGRKRLYLTTDANGKALEVVAKVTTEAMFMVARLEVL